MMFHAFYDVSRFLSFLLFFLLTIQHHRFLRYNSQQEENKTDSIIFQWGLCVAVPDDTFSLSLSISSLGFDPCNMLLDTRISEMRHE